MRKIMAMAVTAIVLAACQPVSTAAITLTAPKTVQCGTYIDLEGTVPDKATPTVVLQRTVDGKWVDWLWYETADSGEKPHRITMAVQRDGSFYAYPRAPISANRTYALRVRSAGGSAWSNTVWVTTKVGPAGYCPSSL